MEMERQMRIPLLIVYGHLFTATRCKCGAGRTRERASITPVPLGEASLELEVINITENVMMIYYT
jgi:hypothetical protein